MTKDKVEELKEKFDTLIGPRAASAVWAASAACLSWTAPAWSIPF